LRSVTTWSCRYFDVSLPAQVRLERAAQARALLAQPIAQRRQQRAGVIEHLARRRDLAPDVVDLGGERRGAADQSAQARELAARSADRRGGGVDRLEVVSEREQTRGLERAAIDLQQAEQILEVFRCPQREDRVVGQVAHRLGRRGQQLADRRQLGGRRQRVKARGAGRRERKAPHRGDNPIEFEGPEAAWAHSVWVWSGRDGRPRSAGCTDPGGNR
jgi:hypothetical protein